MEHFTPIASTFGGLLIGLSASMLLLFNGRIAGISGIFSGLLAPKAGEFGWRLTFVLGLLVGGLLMAALNPGAFAITIERSTPALIAAGVMVGFGVRLGSGCTSGHGVCGLSRLSPRSLTATLTFIGTGAVVVFLTRSLFGGVL